MSAGNDLENSICAVIGIYLRVHRMDFVFKLIKWGS